MNSNTQFNLRSYQYKDFPELISALFIVKEAALRACLKLNRFPKNELELLLKACEKARKEKECKHLQISVYAGARDYLLQAIDKEIISNTGIVEQGLVQKLETILVKCASANAFVITANEIVIRKNLFKLAQVCHRFAEILEIKAHEFENTVKMGRLGLQDYLPMTLGEEFYGYAFGIRKLEKNLEEKAQDFHFNAIGISEMGNLSCYDEILEKESTLSLSELCAYQWVPFENAFDAVMDSSRLLTAHALIQAVSTALWRVARDVRMMCSGPRAGLQEITVPAVAPGSSIMPGKLNPVIAEMVFTTVDQVDANHSGLTMAQKSGWLEGNHASFIPIRSIMNSADLLARTMDTFGKLCIEGITVNTEHNRLHAEKSLALTKVLSLFTGNEAAQKAYRLAKEEGLTIKEAALKLSLLDQTVLNEILDIDRLAKPKEVQKLLAKYAK